MGGRTTHTFPPHPRSICTAPPLLDEAGQFGFRVDGDAVRVVVTGQLRRVAAVGYVGDLGGRERHDAVLGPLPVVHVEVVKIAPGGAHYDDVRHIRSRLTAPGDSPNTCPRPFEVDTGQGR